MVFMIMAVTSIGWRRQIFMGALVGVGVAVATLIADNALLAIIAVAAAAGLQWIFNQWSGRRRTVARRGVVAIIGSGHQTAAAQRLGMPWRGDRHCRSGHILVTVIAGIASDRPYADHSSSSSR
jgi:hypothetical protein